MAEAEMVERVARAIFDATPFKQTEGGYDEQSAVYRRSCLLLARAAIEAMRKPTDEVNDALDRVPGGFGRGAWLEGIDAALSPPSKD